MARRGEGMLSIRGETKNGFCTMLCYNAPYHLRRTIDSP